MSIINVFSALSSFTGIMAGNIAFSGFSNFLPKTIEEALELEGKSILKLNGDEEVGLVLAQQYREYGTVEQKKDRNFSKQTNPGFLSNSDGISSVKHTNSTNSKQEFDKDPRIATLLKQKCKESLTKEYRSSLYKQVTRGCSLELPEHIRSILKAQKENGDCRVGVVFSTKNKFGYFVWEDVNLGFSEQVFAKLKDVIPSKKADCKKDQYLEFQYQINTYKGEKSSITGNDGDHKKQGFS